MNIKAKQIFLLLGDIAVLYLTLYATLLLRYQEFPDQHTWINHFWPFSFAFAGWLIIFYISGLYNLHSAVNNAKFMETVLRANLIAAALTLAIFYITPDILIAPKTNLVIFIFLFSFLFFWWRRIYNQLLYSYLPKINLALVGCNPLAAELITYLQANPHLGYQPQLAVCLNGGENNIRTLTVSSQLESLRKEIVEKKINLIVLADDPRGSLELRTLLFDCLPLGISCVAISRFYETITGKVPIEAINQMWFLENLNQGDKAWFEVIKRIYDFIFASLLLALSLPFWPFFALAVKFSSPGPIFFTQTRAGKNGQPFRMIKFRTMTTKDNDQSPTTANDNRITRAGAFFRKTRIDEIPQVLNILKGEMSFVGPRPERPELAAGLEKEIPFYRERMLVKPGVTGCDQISGEYHSPSREDSLKKLQYDLFYIKNRSIYLDMAVILKTLATVVKGGGR